VVVWPVVLAMIAVLENAVHTLRRTNALLREVAAELAAAPDRAVVVDRRARREVDAAASALSRAIDRWDPATGPSGVRALGTEAFRTWSHRLQQVADDAATTSAPRVAPATDEISIRRRGLALRRCDCHHAERSRSSTSPAHCPTRCERRAPPS
jgi:heme exporter protein D